MDRIKVWDLHCDTLSELRRAENEGRPLSFAKNDLLQIDLEKLKQGGYLLQCFACFVNLGRADENPLVSCLEMIDIFYRLLEEYGEDLAFIRTPEDIRALPGSGKIGAMLTVEEGGVCLDDVRILRSLYRLGVRMMTLTWNHENGLAWPNSVPGNLHSVWPCAPVTDHGLTAKGFEFVEEMESLRMILDVSHLSDGGFWDVVSAAKRPFAASHSDARAVCSHVRNLTDEMIRAMGERGCIAGVNYCPAFLDPRGDREHVKARIADMAVHARHLMDVGGEDLPALGSDFDGITGEIELEGAQDLPMLADGLAKAGFTPRQIEKIFYKNAMRFFEENL